MRKQVSSFRDVPEMATHWVLFLTIGVVMMIIGLLAIIYAGGTTLFTVSLLGFLLLIAGLVQLVNSFHARNWTGVSLGLLLGVLYIVTGAVCISNPMAGAASLTLLIVAFLWVSGLYRVISSALKRFDHWEWTFASGIVAFILGILILAGWPMSGMWMIGVFVGVDIFLAGLTWVLLTQSARDRLK